MQKGEEVRALARCSSLRLGGMEGADAKEWIFDWQIGYFAYGGSTVIAIFPKGFMKFDEVGKCLRKPPQRSLAASTPCLLRAAYADACAVVLLTLSHRTHTGPHKLLQTGLGDCRQNGRAHRYKGIVYARGQSIGVWCRILQNDSSGSETAPAWCVHECIAPRRAANQTLRASVGCTEMLLREKAGVGPLNTRARSPKKFGDVCMDCD